MWRGYEFNCIDCGCGYLRETNELTKCPNKSCKGNYMQLYGVVETFDEAPFGSLAFFVSRKVLDKPAKE